MTRPLDGTCALITGSVRGLGLAAAERLAADGCRLVLCGSGGAEDPDALCARLERTHGGEAIYVDADLRHAAEIARLVAAADESFGGVDVLVNNAVVRHAAPIDAFDPAAWDDALSVNLSAAFHAVRLALPHMRRRGWGRIVNVSSIYGLRGAANRVAYVTTKTALIGLTRAVALETVADGITCNAVCPGTTESPVHDATVRDLMAEAALGRGEAEQRFLAAKQPSGRFVPAGDVAALIAFLCSREAGHITGAVLPIDGGWSAS